MMRRTNTVEKNDTDTWQRLMGRPNNAENLATAGVGRPTRRRTENMSMDDESRHGG